MCRVKVIELRLEHAFFVGLNRMEVETMNDEVAAAAYPIALWLARGHRRYCGSLEPDSPETRPASARGCRHSC